MLLRKSVFPLLLALLLTLGAVPAARADDTPEPLPVSGDFLVRIDGGYAEKHMETVGEQECLRVDLFLDGVTNERLLSSISMVLCYDADVLTYEKHKSLSGNGLMSTLNPNEPGLIRYAFISSSGTLLNRNTPLLTLWFTLSDGLAEETQIRFAIAQGARADSVDPGSGSYQTERRTVGAKLHPFGLGVLYGDANCDGRVTAADASLVLRAIVGVQALSDRGMKNAKVDGAEALSVQDAALILRAVVWLIERFPVEA